MRHDPEAPDEVVLTYLPRNGRSGYALKTRSGPGYYLIESQHEPETRIVLVPHREVSAPHVVVQVEVHPVLERRLVVVERQQRRFARCDERRVQVFDTELIRFILI